MVQKALILIAILLVGRSAVMGGTATTYPSTWDKSQAGTPLPESARSGAPAFDDSFKTLSIGPEEATDVRWYAPIHSQLGAGKMASPDDREAISVDEQGLVLRTRQPGGADGVDVNLQTMNKAGRGFAMQNGYFEVTASLPAALGNHAGIWLLSLNGEQGHGEIDLAESYGKVDRNVHSSVHWWPNLSNSRFAKHVFLGKGFFNPGFNFQGTFHDYGVLLTAEHVIFYFDQKETRRVDRLPEQNVPFYVVLSNFTDRKREEGYEPAVMRVSRVRAWPTDATADKK